MSGAARVCVRAGCRSPDIKKTQQATSPAAMVATAADSACAPPALPLHQITRDQAVWNSREHRRRGAHHQRRTRLDLLQKVELLPLRLQRPLRRRRPPPELAPLG